MNKYTPETGALDTVAPGTTNTQIILITLVSFIAASVILVIFILPAEFNKDPLGLGQQLGLMGLSGSEPAAKTINKESIGYRQDEVSFYLLPFESVEYKYELNEGSAILYSWTVGDEVVFDFHGEPEDGPEGFAESYSMGRSDNENGTFTAPFSGIHGWYWENRGASAVTVKLVTAGFYTAAIEFREGDINKIILGEKPEKIRSSGQ